MLDPKLAKLESSTRASIQPGDGRPAALTPASATAIASGNPTARELLPHIGLRGYLRLARVMTSFLLFMLRVFINTRGWRIKQSPQPELRRQEGALLREKLIKLGPTFIKTGQSLATRADLLPVEYIQELAKLQDEVPPFPTEQARAIIEAELSVKLEDIFDDFDDTTIATASLGQVHRAKLRTGQVVAIKVQRPGIHDQIEFDIHVLRRIARRLERFPNLVRGVEWPGTL